MNNFRLLSLLPALPAFLALSAAHPAAAQAPAIGFAAGATGFEANAAYDLNDPNGSFSLGFEFLANSPVFVTSLGYFNDPSYNPSVPTFAQPHQVGLYLLTPGTANTGTLLASTFVTAGGTANGYFLYQALSTPVALLAGNKYVLAGVTGPTDPYFFGVQDQNGNSALTVDPSITYGHDRVVASSTLVFPTGTDSISEPGYFGPNMILSQSAPVPEASTTVSLGLLLALGLGGLGLSARRRSRSL